MHRPALGARQVNPGVAQAEVTLRDRLGRRARSLQHAGLQHQHVDRRVLVLVEGSERGAGGNDQGDLDPIEAVSPRGERPRERGRLDAAKEVLSGGGIIGHVGPVETEARRAPPRKGHGDLAASHGDARRERVDEDRAGRGSVRVLGDRHTSLRERRGDRGSRGSPALEDRRVLGIEHQPLVEAIEFEPLEPAALHAELGHQLDVDARGVVRQGDPCMHGADARRRPGARRQRPSEDPQRDEREDRHPDCTPLHAATLPADRRGAKFPASTRRPISWKR